MSKRQAGNELSDGDLLQLSEKGDENAFLILYQRHQGSIFRFALHMSGRVDVAEEVVQEVFMALLSKLKLYARDRGELQGYLIGIARNRVRRHLSERRLAEVEPSPESESNALFEGFNKREELAALHDAILKLPPDYREVVVLCDLEDMDYADAARQIGCPVGTVRSRLHRAREILGAKLRKTHGCVI